MYNKLLMVGNLTRDIELRYLQNGTAVANTAIATTRKFTSNGEKKEEVCFIDVTMFGKIAEIANQYTRKGSKVLLDGRVKFEQWTDNNGQKRSKHVFNVETLQMLDSKSDNQQSGNQGYQPEPQQGNGYQPQNAPQQNYQPEPQQGNGYQPQNAPQQNYQPQPNQAPQQPQDYQMPEPQYQDKQGRPTPPPSQPNDYPPRR